MTSSRLGGAEKGRLGTKIAGGCSSFACHLHIGCIQRFNGISGSQKWDFQTQKWGSGNPKSRFSPAPKWTQKWDFQTQKFTFSAPKRWTEKYGIFSPKMEILSSKVGIFRPKIGIFSPKMEILRSKFGIFRPKMRFSASKMAFLVLKWDFQPQKWDFQPQKWDFQTPKCHF